jgi:hypothetical protein
MKKLMKNILSLLLFSTIAVLASCSDDDNNKAVVCNQVKEYIAQHYPGAIIRDAEYSRGYFEVEIYHDARIKDVYFDNADRWVATKWDVSIADLPAAVVTSLRTSYQDYKIDDADFVVTPEREVYYVELERGNYERAVYVKADGTILSE